jgi:hydroxymethylpyrimidine pyrophosphatase-like HAD family hydrolase
LSSSTYLVIDNVYTFAIRDIDSYEFLKDSYGDDATSKYTVYDENKTISGHPAAIIYQEVSINQMDGTGYKTYDVVEVYFQTGDSIYCISYNGTKLTSDVEEMIKHTPKPSDSSDMFYEKLGRARDNYLKEYDEESEDYLYDLIDENTRTTRDKRGFYW